MHITMSNEKIKENETKQEMKIILYYKHSTQTVHLIQLNGRELVIATTVVAVVFVVKI